MCHRSSGGEWSAADEDLCEGKWGSAHHVTESAEAHDADFEAGLVQVVVLERRVDGDAGAQQRRRAVQRQVARDVQHEAARKPGRRAVSMQPIRMRWRTVPLKCCVHSLTNQSRHRARQLE